MAKYTFLTVKNVMKEIKYWRPRNCKTEIQYRNSLFNKIEEAFKIVPVKEYGAGRVRADLAYGKKIAIELKYNFDSTGKYHRLIGQLDDYSREFKNVIVVLVGKTDLGLYKDLKRAAPDIWVMKKG